MARKRPTGPPAAKKRHASDVAAIIKEARKESGPAGRFIRMLAEVSDRLGLPAPVTEHAFAKGIGRAWRFDIAWPSYMLAVEIEGGIVGKPGGKPCPLCGNTQKGAHGSVSGILRDIQKYNAAVLLGWRVLRIPTSEINWQSVQVVATALGFKGRRAVARRVVR